MTCSMMIQRITKAEYAKTIKERIGEITLETD